MQDSITWRELLGKIIRDPQEKQYIANELGISPLTLTRWVSGESTPRPQNLRHLLMALPNYRKMFLELIPEEFGYSLTEPISAEHNAYEIPSSFYARVLNAHANLPKILHFTTVCDIILQQALKQLDPNLIGVEVTVVQCMPPAHDQIIRSLRESVGRGTGFWSRELAQRTLFLGSESLTGYVVATGRPLALQSHREGENLFPSRWVEWEESAMAAPIMHADKVAGCLLVSCTQSDYFRSLARYNLIQSFAELLSIVFDTSAFYELRHIALARMPSFAEQYAHISSFRQRANRLQAELRIGMLDAENLAWQEVEAEILCAGAKDATHEQKIGISHL